MTAVDSGVPISTRLRPEIAAYGVGCYSLRDDLSHLQNVRQAGATEATIFYCARILEVLAAEGVRIVGLTPSVSSFSNLESLCQFNLMPATTLYWANALRRMGNDVRHILRKAAPQDADLAALFAERWVEWFFCYFSYGAKLPSLTVDESPILPAKDAALPPLLRAIDRPDFDPMAWLPDRWTGAEPPYMAASTIAAAIVNLLLDRGETESAFTVLEPAMARFPDDLRLQQLNVLAWKRRGNLETAAEKIGPLLARSKDDDETAGIVAGVYKQVYMDRGRDPEILGKSFRAYLGGWDGSKASNAYLGINAAALALWLGRQADSRRLAGEVRQVLLKRMAALASRKDQTNLSISYWDEVTLAEAELLLGELGSARRRYQDAFAHSAKNKGNIKVASDQADRHLAPLGLTISAKVFFAPRAASVEAATVAIGITGHRTLADEVGLRMKIHEAVEKIQRDATADGKSPTIVMLSSLAAGADCLAAEVALDDFAGALRAVLPLELADYRRDFAVEQLARFQALLNRADALVFPPPPPKPQKGKGAIAVSAQDDREAAYERAGRFVVDQCKVLIALWDGKPSRGRGGTAEIVAYAKKTGKEMVWIQTELAPQ
jgi:hypothetical protein